MTKDEFLDLKKRAESGHLESMRKLASAYFFGNGTQKDASKYFEWVERAAEAGDPESMRRLGFAYMNGHGTEKDASEFFKWTKKAAEAGDRSSMYGLALMYILSEGVEEDLGEYFKWMKSAAEAGHSKAMYSLASAYQYGYGTEKDESESSEWMQKAAEAGDPQAMLSTAFANLGGRETEGDLEKYFEWIRKAAEEKVPEAIILLGLEELKIEDEFEQLVLSLIVLYRLVQEKKEEHVVGVGDIGGEEGGSKKLEGVAHFTDMKAAKSVLMLQGEKDKRNADKQMNLVRLYNVSYVNDPQEGKRLVEVAKKTRRAFKHFFTDDGGESKGKGKPLDHHIMLGGVEYSVYIGSFTLRTDSLDLWRAYGRDGKGFCIVSPLSAFQQEQGLDSGMFKYSGVEKNDKIGSIKTEEGVNRLYKVKYTETDAKKTLKFLDEPLKEIKKICDGFKGKNKKINEGIVKARVRAILSEILYLYKSKEYSTEKEARLISAHTISDDRLQLDEGTPSRLYVESAPLFFEKDASAIIIGPKVSDKIEAMMELRYRLTKNGWVKNTAVEMSTVQYR